MLPTSVLLVMSVQVELGPGVACSIPSALVHESITDWEIVLVSYRCCYVGASGFAH